MKRQFILALVFLTLFAAGASAENWFLIKQEDAEAALLAEDPLPYFEAGLRQFFKDNPLANKLLAQEMNLNNGSMGWGKRNPVGERYMFGRATNAAGVKDLTVDTEIVYNESLRLLFGPWYSSKAYTYSTQKNLGWFPWHLDLTTGEFFKTDPRSPDLGIRVFHYTDYDHRNQTTTLGVYFNKECEVEGYYWCHLTIIRKTSTK